MNPIRNPLLLLAAVAVLAAPCFAQGDPEADDPHAAHAAHAQHFVSFAAVDYAIEAPDAVPSGWNTLQFVNDGEEHHFVILLKLPEGKTFENYETEVTATFNDIWIALREGEVDQQGAIGQLMQTVPEWFWAVQTMGGAGFSAPGVASEVTLNLEPGNYVVECYMKTAEGEFHAMEGMMRPLVVTDEPSGAGTPEPTLHLTLSNAGIDIQGDVTPGKHTVAVHFAEQPEEGFPHDVNVARLDDDTNIEDVVAWMSWLNVDGLAPAAPATFVGGARPMPAGHTAYFTLDLEPGRYLFISEATGYQGVLKEVRVTKKHY